MQLVCPRCGHGSDLTAGPLSIFGAIAVPEDVEFAYRFNAKQLLADAGRLIELAGGVVAHVVHTVYGPPVVFCPLAGDRERGSAGIRPVVGSVGIERHQLVEAAAVQR